MHEDDRLEQLRHQLDQLTETFERDMRARGFDPAQAENAALPTSLAQLYLQRESLKEQVEEVSKSNEQ